MVGRVHSQICLDFLGASLEHFLVKINSEQKTIPFLSKSTHFFINLIYLFQVIDQNVLLSNKIAFFHHQSHWKGTTNVLNISI